MHNVLVRQPMYDQFGRVYAVWFGVWNRELKQMVYPLDPREGRAKNALNQLELF